MRSLVAIHFVRRSVALHPDGNSVALLTDLSGITRSRSDATNTDLGIALQAACKKIVQRSRTLNNPRILIRGLLAWSSRRTADARPVGHGGLGDYSRDVP